MAKYEMLYLLNNDSTEDVKAAEVAKYEDIVKNAGGVVVSTEKIGTKKTYISRIENGKADIQLGTLFRIFEGLGKRVSLTIL
jgi:ribosomal protein S6